MGLKLVDLINGCRAVPVDARFFCLNASAFEATGTLLGRRRGALSKGASRWTDAYKENQARLSLDRAVSELIKAAMKGIMRFLPKRYGVRVNTFAGYPVRFRNDCSRRC
jgi:hypothetical protein